MINGIICEYDRNNKCYQHIYDMFEIMIKKHNFIFDNVQNLLNNSGNIKNYLLEKYNCIPEYYITFFGIGTLNPIIDELSSVLKVILISDDIHHGKSVANPRKNVFKKAFKTFNTYGYQLYRWNVPIVRENYFFPHSARWIIPFNDNPINKILVSGNISDIYTDRKYITNLNNPNVDILNKDNNSDIFKKKYYEYLNKYLCCFVDTARDYVLAKVFEICGSGSLLLCSNPVIMDIFSQLGFIDNVNYISCNQENMMEKINYIVNPDNRIKIDDIRKKGQELIRNKHYYKNRLDMFLKILYYDSIKINIYKHDKTEYKNAF